MRLTILLAAAALVLPAALTAHAASVPGITQDATDLSAAAKTKKPAKKKEENLKAAPSAPSTKDKSTY